MNQENLIELLATLDHLVAKQTHWSLQDEDIDDKIHQILVELVAIIENRYTEDQVRNYFFEEFKRGDTWPDHNFPRLFKYGSSEIKTLDSQMRKLIEEKLDEIILSQPWQIPRRRQSRPSSVKSSNIIVKTKSNAPAAVLQSSGRVTATRMSSDLSQKSWCENAKTLIEDASNRTSRSSDRRSHPKVVIPAIRINKTHRHPPVPSLLTGNSNTSSQTQKSESPLCSTTVILPPEPDDFDAFNPINCEISSSSAVPSIALEIYDSLATEYTNHRIEWKKVEVECINLKKRMRQMESVYQVHRGIPEQMIEDLDQKLQKINDLKRKRDDLRILQPFFPSDQMAAIIPIPSEFFDTFRDMKCQIWSILVENIPNKSLDGAFRNQSDDLSCLLSTVGFSYQIKEDLESSIPLLLSELIQAFTGAAVYRWVFESSYYTHSLTSTPLLQEYREHLAQLCGDERLYTLDVAAHHSIIEHKDFREVTILHQAAALTARLLTMIHPFLVHIKDKEEMEELKLSFDHIFKQAIRIRSLSLIANEEYEIIWPSIGAAFDKSTMETGSSGDLKTKNLVKFSLSPGLQAYPKRRGLVTYKGFGIYRGTERMPKYTIKALVII